MKKFYQILAVAGLSFLTVGAFAQTPASMKGKPTIKSVVKGKFAHAKAVTVNHGTKKVTSGANNALIDYLAGDQTLTGGTFYHWLPVLNVNRAYTIKDTNSYYNLSSNYAFVTFDTIWDIYNGGGSFDTPVFPGTLTLDTINAEIQYHNTSGLNDTILFTINGVNASGFINTLVVYGVDTVVVAPGFFADNTLDSTQFLQVVESTNIPSTARKGYNFAISMTSLGSKLDTIAVSYYSQGGTACSAAGGEYNPEPTTMGVADGAVKNVNSFATGLYYQNAAGQHGTNVSQTWPLTTGTYAGYCSNGGGYYSSPLPWALIYPTCTGDTNFWAVQDIGIYPSVSYSPTAVQNIEANGLSVGQNYPNPANGTTEISYSITKSSDVVFSVYDMTGRKIMENSMSEVAPGQHYVILNTNQFTPGVYMYTFNVNGVQVTKRMVVTQ